MPHVQNQPLIAKYSSSPAGAGGRLTRRKAENKSGQHAKPANVHIKIVAILILMESVHIFIM